MGGRRAQRSDPAVTAADIDAEYHAALRELRGILARISAEPPLAVCEAVAFELVDANLHMSATRAAYERSAARELSEGHLAELERTLRESAEQAATRPVPAPRKSGGKHTQRWLAVVIDGGLPVIAAAVAVARHAHPFHAVTGAAKIKLAAAPPAGGAGAPPPPPPAPGAGGAPTPPRAAPPPAPPTLAGGVAAVAVHETPYQVTMARPHVTVAVPGPAVIPAASALPLAYSRPSRKPRRRTHRKPSMHAPGVPAAPPAPLPSPTPLPPSVPPPGTLEVQTAELSLTPDMGVLDGAITFYASGGPVAWRALACPGVALSAYGGVLSAGQPGRVTVTVAAGTPAGTCDVVLTAGNVTADVPASWG